jgi:hypothetical protein
MAGPDTGGTTMVADSLPWITRRGASGRRGTDRALDLMDLPITVLACRMHLERHRMSPRRLLGVPAHQLLVIVLAVVQIQADARLVGHVEGYGWAVAQVSESRRPEPEESWRCLGSKWLTGSR